MSETAEPIARDAAFAEHTRDCVGLPGYDTGLLMRTSGSILADFDLGGASPEEVSANIALWVAAADPEDGMIARGKRIAAAEAEIERLKTIESRLRAALEFQSRQAQSNPGKAVERRAVVGILRAALEGSVNGKNSG